MKVLIYAQNCHWLELHPLHIKEIEGKDKFKQLLLNISASN